MRVSNIIDILYICRLALKNSVDLCSFTVALNMARLIKVVWVDAKSLCPVSTGGQQYRISRGCVRYPVSAGQLFSEDSWADLHCTTKLHGATQGIRTCVTWLSYVLGWWGECFLMFDDCFLFSVPLHLCTHRGVCQLQVSFVSENWWHASGWSFA